MYYKTTLDGNESVCEAVHNYAVKYAQNSYNEGVVKTLINLVNSGNITLECAIANSGLSKEEFSATAKELGLSC